MRESNSKTVCQHPPFNCGKLPPRAREDSQLPGCLISIHPSLLVVPFPLKLSILLVECLLACPASSTILQIAYCCLPNTRLAGSGEQERKLINK
uniref:Uncharacterized protein n=1 Tax=Ditylenchus dipsaci TaxID=166011 RepID=A0A915ETM5_9BILA